MKSVEIFRNAWKTVFKQKKTYLALVITSFLVFSVFIIIPVVIVPGNDVPFQLSIMPFTDIITLILLALITGVAVIFNIYIFQQKKHLHVDQLGNAGITGVAALLSSFFGTITCIACAATVLGFLGLTTVTFALHYRIFFAVASIFLMIGSVYFTARKVLHICERCTS